MAKSKLKELSRRSPDPAGEDIVASAENVPDSDDPKPVDQGRVPPVRSRDEANIDSDEALPNDREERSIADDPSREETRFGEVKPPKP
ncbi:hypothetical protein PYH37_001670 [Sinorhizobium numidicum]|uniref:Uncharacterized protein n=1 Tax=Sinorhizobium numidicum TaxID=680248 RepID=A0ABY8CTC5_9HYPH|nr:hypothetical protein [Sinorhizobium numidicum]WEX74275.1 hypothetical protein PYH37_001670 [Sinorhizobium numidicum]WEX80261.1 hypothetical protein PYH38_001671 [Sinorhizobium numidicum]